jgi:PAS domain S-box-containing protein
MEKPGNSSKPNNNVPSHSPPLASSTAGAALQNQTTDNAYLHFQLETEARYRQILEHSPEALAIHQNGRLVYVNPAAVKLIGATSSAQLIGKPLLELVHPDYHQLVIARVKQTQQQATVGELVEEKFVRLDGRTIDVEVVALPTTYQATPATQVIVRDVTERKRNQAAQQLLIEASNLFTTSLDLQTILNQLTHLIVPRLADFCIVDLLDEVRNELYRPVVAHVDQAKEQLMYEVQRRYPPELKAASGLGQTLRQGKPVLRTRVAPERLLATAQNDEHRAILEELAPLSAIAIPLLTRGRTIGILSLATTHHSQRVYDEQDLGLAEELGRRAALAIDNARLYLKEQAAHQTADRLREVTARLASALTPAQVAEVITTHGVAALQSQAGFICLRSKKPDYLEVVSWTGYSPGLVAEWQTFPLQGPGATPASWVVRSGEALWLETIEDEAVAEQNPELIEALRASSSSGATIVLPLVLEGQVAGAFGLSFKEKRRFSQDEKATILALSQQCAQALERARLYEAERKAHKEAEQHQNRLSFLARVSEVLSSSLDYQTTLQNIADLAVPEVADWCSVYLPQQNPQTGQAEINQLAVAHIDPAKVELARQFRKRYPISSEETSGVAAVLKSGQPEVVPHIPFEILEQTVSDREQLNFLRELGITGYIAAPMKARGQTLGVLNLITASFQRQFDETDLSLALELARRAGNAIDNARLYLAEQLAHQEAENARYRLAFLAQASEILGTSLDYEETLTKLARLTLPILADYCVIDMVEGLAEEEEEGAGGNSIPRLERVAVAHVEPDKEQLMREIQQRYPPDPASPNGIPKAVRTGQTEIVSQINQEDLRQYARSEEHYQALVALAATSGISVPLVGHAGVLGVLTLAFAKSGRVYGPQDVAVAEELARRAAIAVENTRLYRAAQQAVRLRDEFLSIAAHELKTPITSLKGYSQLLLRQFEQKGQSDPTKLVVSLNVLNQQANRLTRLVEQLLDVSRLETGKLKLDLQPTDLVEVLEQVLANVSEAERVNSASSGSSPYTFSLNKGEASEPIIGVVDSLRLEQVITNLVTNAIKYSPGGGPIMLEVAQVDNEPLIQLVVEDRGIGIPPEARSHLFERFYQVQPGQYNSGMGLGLYISRQIIELHGGTIRVEFPEEGGSRFVVQLPLEMSSIP